MSQGKYIIGLTGNIATGKSRVRELLEKLGAFTIDADKLAHHLMAPGTQLQQKVVEAFGRDILDGKGGIDRKKLGERVFAEAGELVKLEAIVHPAVAREALKQALAAPGRIVVIEAVKLVEAGMHTYCDELWVVICPEELASRRMCQERGWTREEAERRLKAQPEIQTKLALADVVIDNSGDFARTERKVREEWQRVVAKVAGARP